MSCHYRMMRSGFWRACHVSPRATIYSREATGRYRSTVSSKAKRALDARMREEMRQLPPFVIHDIRRTMRTGLSTLPVPDLVRELVIAHTRPGLHKVYDLHAYESEKRHALDLWAKRLRDIIDAAA